MIFLAASNSFLKQTGYKFKINTTLKGEKKASLLILNIKEISVVDIFLLSGI